MTSLFSDRLVDEQSPVVQKRSGDSVESFSLAKLERALTAAFLEVGHQVAPEKITQIALLVKTKILMRYENLVAVEDIQDLVESTLMEIGAVEVAKSYILYRSKREGIRDARLVPDPTAISDYIHPAKYSRFLPDKKRRETYEETVSRVEDMHLRKFPHVAAEIREAFDFVRAKKVLPSMRSMQFAGPAIEGKNPRQFNCCYLLLDKMRAFKDTLYLLLCGSGVGYSVQYDHVDKLPPLKHIDKNNVVHHTIVDTIEGWANALDKLLSSYVRGYYIEFNYNKIRSEGSFLKTSGGKAPGHLGLKKALENVRTVLDGAQGRQLRPIECYDIQCFSADAVLSGGIRRSATIALFSLEDGEMMAAKTGNWFARYPWRANSNNSAVLKRGDVHKRQFKRVFKCIKEFGEPGFVFVNDYDHGFNPCQPAWAPILTPDGLRTMGDISVGDKIWSAEGWTTVVKKWSTGVKDVNQYRTSAGVFYGTENHRVISRGEKVEAGDADAIDLLVGPETERVKWDPQVVLDGIFFGDGFFHNTREYTHPVIHIGVNDQSYFKSEVAAYIGARHGRADAFVVDTGVLQEDYKPPKDKVIPPRYTVDPAKVVSFLRGLYTANGSVVRGRVTLKSVSERLIEQVQVLLSTLGITSYVTTNKSKVVKFPQGPCVCKESYDLNIGTDRGKFFKLIGFVQPYKMAKLEATLTSIGAHKKTSYAIQSVEYVSTEEVFDITVDNSSHTYWTGGLNVSNCVEISLNPVLTVDEQVMALVERKRSEGQFIPKIKLGEVYTGTAFCNLSEINAAACKTPEDLYAAARMAARIGTLQASYTDFAFLGWVSEVIAEREALLGVSMTGMKDSPEVSLDQMVQRLAAGWVVAENKEFAEKIGILQAARATCVKPAGSTSLELGCVGSGIHDHHARRYLRRVTANEHDVVFQYFRSVNPHMCQKKPNGDWVIEFPIMAPSGATVKGDLGAVEFLEIVRSTQNNWVKYGNARPDSSPGMSHNVSNTVVVQEHEWDDVAEHVWAHRDDFSGISFLPATGDKDYAFAPCEAISTEADEEKWNNLLRHYTPVDYTLMIEDSDSTDLSGEISCAGGACEV